MLEYYFYGAGLRFGQSIVFASLWILIGLFIASVFRYMLGPEKVRSLFGNGTRRGIFTGWLMGMLLPVCSLGVIPIVREMYRSGVKGGTIIAFALTAPLFNPMSVLYGLTLSDPIAIIAFTLCALVIVTLLGVLWDWYYSDSNADPITEKMPTPGIKRVAAVVHGMCRELTGVSGALIVLGIIGSVLMAISFEKGHLQSEVERDNWLAPINVAAIALPIYSTPLLAMSQIGGMFQHGNSIGAAFSLLILGAGANIGVVAWFVVTFGWRRTVTFLAVLSATTIALAYAVDKPLYPKGIEPAGHSHAFDVYTHPFHRQQLEYGSLMKSRMATFWEDNELGGTSILGGFFLLGLVLRMVGAKRIEPWFYTGGDKKNTGFDIYVPEWTLGATAVLGLVSASVAGTFLYYPSPEQLLPDMFNVNTECVLTSRSKNWEAAEKHITHCDNLSRRLEVGVFLRNGSVDPFMSAKAKTYREKLDLLKQAVEGRDEDNIDKLAMDVSNSYLRLSTAFKGKGEFKGAEDPDTP